MKRTTRSSLTASQSRRRRSGSSRSYGCGQASPSAFKVLNTQLQRGDVQVQKTVGQHYHLRVEALLRQYGDDSTAQVVKAYVAKVKPHLKNYLPKREEVISLAYKFFFKGVKSLGGMH
jgi:hypothetical protein